MGAVILIRLRALFWIVCLRVSLVESWLQLKM